MPSGLNTAQSSIFLWPMWARRCRPVATSQKRTTSSRPAEMRRSPSRLNCTDRTPCRCPTRTAHRIAARDVPDANGAVFAGGGEVAFIVVEGGTINRSRVAVEGFDRLAGVGFPEVNAIVAAGYDLLSIAAECDAPDRAFVLAISQDFGSVRPYSKPARCGPRRRMPNENRPARRLRQLRRWCDPAIYALARRSECSTRGPSSRRWRWPSAAIACE